MADTNVVVISGRIVKDPELKTNPTGTSYCQFNIANNKSKEEASFFYFTAFGKTAEYVASYMKKGSYVNVTGRVDQRKYKNKEGVEQTMYAFVANEVNFAGGRRDDAEETSAPDKTAAKVPDKTVVKSAPSSPSEKDEENPEVLPF